MKLKKILSIALASVIGLTLVGCGETESINTEDSESVNEISEEDGEEDIEPIAEDVLSIGIMGDISTLPIIVADEYGYFEEEGLDVDIQIFKAAKDRDAALQAYELDGVISDEVAIAIYQNADIDMKITGYTEGAFILVSSPNSGITTIEELEGKTVGISENTAIDYTLDYMLEESGLPLDYVERVAVPAMPTRLEMLKVDELDAAIMPNPFAYNAISAGGTELMVVDESNRFISITSFLQDVLDNRSSDIETFYKAVDKATEYINSSDISEFEDIIIDVIGYPESMRGSISIPKYRTYCLPSEDEVNSVFDWCREHGLLSIDIEAKDVIVDLGIGK